MYYISRGPYLLRIMRVISAPEGIAKWRNAPKQKCIFSFSIYRNVAEVHIL